MTRSLTSFVLSLLLGCTCSSSHERDAGHDAPVRLDTPPPPIDAPPVDTTDGGLACWTWCEGEGSRITGTVVVDGEPIELRHALVHTSYGFAVYLQVTFLDDDDCSMERDLLVVELVSTDPSMPISTADPNLGENTVRVTSPRVGTSGLGTMDVSAWEAPPDRPGWPRPSGGRLAAHIVASIPRTELDVTIDVGRCADESGP